MTSLFSPWINHLTYFVLFMSYHYVTATHPAWCAKITTLINPWWTSAIFSQCSQITCISWIVSYSPMAAWGRLGPASPWRESREAMGGPCCFLLVFRLSLWSGFIRSLDFISTQVFFPFDPLAQNHRGITNWGDHDQLADFSGFCQIFSLMIIAQHCYWYWYNSCIDFVPGNQPWQWWHLGVLCYFGLIWILGWYPGNFLGTGHAMTCIESEPHSWPCQY